MSSIQLFLFLQLLDFLTTVLGLRLGAGEASPFVRLLMTAGPAAGVVLSKLVAMLLLGLCIWLHKRHVITWANYWFAATVAWNLCVILMLPENCC